MMAILGGLLLAFALPAAGLDAITHASTAGRHATSSLAASNAAVIAPTVEDPGTLDAAPATNVRNRAGARHAASGGMVESRRHSNPHKQEGGSEVPETLGDSLREELVTAFWMVFALTAVVLVCRRWWPCARWAGDGGAVKYTALDTRAKRGGGRDVSSAGGRQRDTQMRELLSDDDRSAPRGERGGSAPSRLERLGASLGAMLFPWAYRTLRRGMQPLVRRGSPADGFYDTDDLSSGEFDEEGGAAGLGTASPATRRKASASSIRRPTATAET